jgi:glycosyltransferase involved in cell wall biosynthesis
VKTIDHIVVLCRYLPDHTKSSGELRFWHILRRLCSRSRSLTVFSETDGDRHLCPDLPVHPMSTLAGRRPRDVDLAFLEFWFMDLYLPILRGWGIPVILDSVDIEFVRREREKVALGISGDYFHLEKAREIDVYRAVDQVWAVSAADAAEIRALNPNIVIVPNIFDPVGQVCSFAERQGICFVGSYSHQPNVDGLRWYREAIYPRLCDIPHTIIGTGAPEDIQSMPGFVGSVPSSVEYVSRARVSIAPLRYGAGLKGKVLEALACGTPVVTTAIGDEGYAASGNGCAIVARDAEEFSAAVRKLMVDEPLWTRMSARATKFAARYAPDCVGPTIDRALEAVHSSARLR